MKLNLETPDQFLVDISARRTEPPCCVFRFRFSLFTLKCNKTASDRHVERRNTAFLEYSDRLTAENKLSLGPSHMSNAIY